MITFAPGTGTATATEHTFNFLRRKHAITVGISGAETTSHRFRQTFHLFLVDDPIAIAIEALDQTATGATSIGALAISIGTRRTTATEHAIKFCTADASVTIGIGFADTTTHPFRETFDLIAIEHAIAIAIETLDQAGTTTASASTLSIGARSRNRIISGPHHRRRWRSRMIVTGDRLRCRNGIRQRILRDHQGRQQECQEKYEN